MTVIQFLINTNTKENVTINVQKILIFIIIIAIQKKKYEL